MIKKFTTVQKAQNALNREGYSFRRDGLYTWWEADDGRRAKMHRNCTVTYDGSVNPTYVEYLQ